MTQEEANVVKKAAEYLYYNLNLPEEEKQWWVNDFIEYMDITL